MGKNKCELTCRPENANFYYNWAEKVVDGTKCDAFGEDICVDGICLPVGCDGKLGSGQQHQGNPGRRRGERAKNISWKGDKRSIWRVKVWWPRAKNAGN